MTPMKRLDSAVGMPAVIARRALVLDDDAEDGFESLTHDARALGERAARGVLRADERASVFDLQSAAGAVVAVWAWSLGGLEELEAAAALRYARRDIAAGTLLRSDPDRAVVVESVVQHAVRELDTPTVISVLEDDDRAARIGDYAARLAIASADALGARLPMTHLEALAIEVAHSAGQAAAGVVPGFDGFDLTQSDRLSRSASATLHEAVRSRPSGGANSFSEA
jgi:hypothetical protein